MVKIENYIPNALTLANLACGFMGILSCFSGADIDFYGYFLITKSNLTYASWFLLAGAGFDVLDGLSARILKTQSDMGKQLDSLSDVVTFGVLPGAIIYQLLIHSHTDAIFGLYFLNFPVVALLSLMLPLSAAYRLAKFNILPDNTHYFIGLPTPAMGIVIGSLPLIFERNTFLFFDSGIAFAPIITNVWVLLGVTFALSYLMVSKIKFITIKFKGLSFAQNKDKYLLIGLSFLLFAVLLWLAIPIIIVIYLILSQIVYKPKINEV